MMMNQKKLDIVIFALSRFDGPYSSISISLAKEFSKNNRVFYINHPYSLKDFFSLAKDPHMRKKMLAGVSGKTRYKEYNNSMNPLVMVTPPLTLPINFLSPGNLYQSLQKFNDKIVFSCIRRMIRDYKIKNFIFINTYDSFFTQNFPSDIKPYIKIYQCVDDIAEVPYTHKHGSSLEKQMMRNFDITLTTSNELLRLKKPFAKNIYYLPNAVDSSIFNKAAFNQLERPSEFKIPSKKVIGFIGNIERRTNFQLLKKVAEYHNDKLLYLIGPISDNEYKGAGIDKIDNVVFTGGKKIEELPNYLQQLDCAIIPFKCNKLTKSIYPLKVNEYLAGGKPVVTTNFSEDIRLFKEVIYIANDEDEFVTLIDTAISQDNQELVQKRVAFSSKNTWSNRVKDFWNIINLFEIQQEK